MSKKEEQGTISEAEAEELQEIIADPEIEKLRIAAMTKSVIEVVKEQQESGSDNAVVIVYLGLFHLKALRQKLLETAPDVEVSGCMVCDSEDQIAEENRLYKKDVGEDEFFLLSSEEDYRKCMKWFEQNLSGLFPHQASQATSAHAVKEREKFHQNV